MKILIARSAGFCFGVRRAMTMAEETVRNKKKHIFTLGPLIHNPQEVKRLARSGIRSIQDPKNLKKATLILRTHGIPRATREKLERERIEIVDATCPFVKRAQDIIKELSNGDVQIIIIGEKTHPEVVALKSYGGGKCVVVEKPADLGNVAIGERVCVVSQTTQTPENFNDCIKAIRKKNPPVKIYNTICRATMDRQEAASRLAKRVDVMIVVGGKNSGNTRRLFDLCRGTTPSYHIETAGELRRAWFAKARTVGITAGASTPDWIIEKVKCTIDTMSIGDRQNNARRHRHGKGEV